MFSDRAIQMIAQAKIDQAIRDGDFDHLKGLGKPFDFDELSYDPHWWIRRKMKSESMHTLRKMESQR